MPATGQPKYLRLARSFERQLRAGALRIGDRLPSIRQLREEHRVSAATAVSCYVWLEQQGYVRARAKSGFYVSRLPMAGAPAAETRALRPVPVHLDASDGTAVGPVPDEVLDLGPAVVGRTLLPASRLNRSLRLALSTFDDNAIRYEHPRGNLRLRRQIARLSFRQGAVCSPDDILITAGETEALHLAIRALTRPGDIVAVESPGCYEFLQALDVLGLQAVEIPHVPRQGIDLEALAAAAARHAIAAVVLNATCHNVLGDCVSDERKDALVSFAAGRGIPIVEGDNFGDLVFTHERPRPLKAFDRDGGVVQCASLAHHVAPGFNVGWVIGGRFQPAIERLKALTSVAGASLPQLALAEFLESGAYDRHTKRLRRELAASVEASRQYIVRRFPRGTRVSQPDGGFVLWIALPDRFDGVGIARQAASLGIRILPGVAFSATRRYRNCIRIACGHPFTRLKPALHSLASLLSH